MRPLTKSILWTIFFIGALFAFGSAVYGQDVEVNIPAQKVVLKDVQTKAQTKFQLDSLATVLRSEMGSVSPGQPQKPDCEHGISLVSVYDQNRTGTMYNFYSVGVKNITEVVYGSNGREVYRHKTENVTSDRIYLPYNLRAGEYSLVVENADCNAVSNAVHFTIPEGGTGGNPDPPVSGFSNPGVYSHQQGAVLYEWLPSELIDVEIIDGRVKLSAPESKRSWDGKNNCKRFVLGDLYDNKLSDADERALFGEGLALPPGQYGFKIMYINASTWADVQGNMWRLIGYNLPGGEGNSNSARAESIQISITDGSRIQGLDSQLFRASWIPQYQLLPYSLSLPEDKAFGVTRYLTSVQKDSLLSKITHLQYVYSWLDNVNKSRTWKNTQAIGNDGSWTTHGAIDDKGNRIPDNIVEPQWAIDRAIINRGYIIMSEYAENYGNHRGCPPCYDKAEEFFKGVYGRFQREAGVTSPYQTWIVSDYFSPLYGGSFGLAFDERSTTLSLGLSSINYARSRIYDGRWYTSDYFGRGWYNYRNYLSQGYLSNLLGQAGKPAFYERLYNHEKANLAMTDRKKLVYSTNAQEGLHMDKVTISGVWYRTKFDEGELLRADGIIHPFNTMLSDAFYSLLLGNAYVIWESNVPMDADPYTFRPSWFGGYDESKTKWKANGSNSYTTYKPGNNGPPEKNVEGQFPEKPLVGDQGAWVGAKMYESITGRVDQLWYPDFTVNGKQVIAKRGSKGQFLSYGGVQNEGQDNIVKVYESKLPVVIKGKGPKGKTIIYQNPEAGLTEEQGVEVDGKFFKVTGNRLNIISI